MVKVLVLGYYNRNNLGDDAFEYTFHQFFKTHNKKDFSNSLEYTIENLDNIEEIPNDTDIVLFGGGDLINDYFINKLNRLTTPKKCPIYAVGIGIPYPQLIDQGYLDCFDFIVHRNQHDHSKLALRYGEHRVKHFPDLTTFLPKIVPSGIQSKYLPNCFNNPSDDTIKIGVCLAGSLYSSKDPSKYELIVEHLSAFFLRLANVKNKNTSFFSCLNDDEEQPKYEIVFIPFCTDENSLQNDNNINEKLYTSIQTFQRCHNVKIVQRPIPIEEVLSVFSKFDYTVCTRFHAHIFSVLCNVPVLSVYSSRKVENLLEELNLVDYAYKMDVEPEYLYPIEVNQVQLMDKFVHLVKNRANVVKDLQTYNALNKERVRQFNTVLTNLLFYPIRHYTSREIENLARLKCSDIVNNITNFFDLDLEQLPPVDEISHQPGSLGRLISTISNIHPTKSIEDIKETVSEIMTFELVKSKHCDYNYGMIENEDGPEYNLFESCKWVLEHHQLKYENTLQYKNVYNTMPFKFRKLNMNFLVQHGLRGYHRSGWNYVLQHLQALHNPSNDAVVFDSYLDKTFGWEYEFLSKIGFLPYTKRWIGVFHHTQNQSYSDHNLVKVFEKTNFIESLRCCQMLIVFSDYLKEWIEIQLKKFDLEKVPSVVSLIHPTQLIDDCLQFNYIHYLLNRHKKVVHIGAWLRNTYAIYELNVPKRFTKCTLKGKDMNNYFVSDETIDCISDCILDCVCHTTHIPPGVNNGCIISRDVMKTNKYALGLIDFIRRNHSSVQIIEMLSNEKYDQLLSRNIVFVNLIDASAVNTLIECIVRNTPILVNRLPATVQYLGEDYPLFYNSFDHAKQLLQSDRTVFDAHKYLKKLDKTKFTVLDFMKKLVYSERYQSI